jgi:hypothetical protein
MTRFGDNTEMPLTVEHDDHAVISPVRTLAERAARPGSSRDTERLLAQAEEQLASLRQEFPQWMAAEFDKVEQAWASLRTGASDGKARLFRAVHDVRGQASTFGYPLAGRAADGLCKLMDALDRVPDDVIEAHVQAMGVIVRENVNTDDHPVGIKMIAALENLGNGLIVRALRDKDG